MEDYNSPLVSESKNEWTKIFINVLTPHIRDGFKSIFNEALELCEENDEPDKYLMTFQNFIYKIPSWNNTTVEKEVELIKEKSGCSYLEDLITCVHVIQLKILNCARSSNFNKKIEIDIPDINSFIHKTYINVARKLYVNCYLFQVDVSPLEQQKHNREFELIIESCISNTVNESIPIENLIRQYMDESEVENQYITTKVIGNDTSEEDNSGHANENDKEKKGKENDNSNTVVQEHTVGDILNEVKNTAPVITNSESELEEVNLDIPKPVVSEPEPVVEEVNISFNNDVNTFDPVNNETTTQSLEPMPISMSELKPIDNNLEVDVIPIDETNSLDIEEIKL